MGADDPLASLAFEVLRGSDEPLSGEEVGHRAGLTPLGVRVAFASLRRRPGVTEHDGGWAYHPPPEAGGDAAADT